MRQYPTEVSNRWENPKSFRARDEIAALLARNVHICVTTHCSLSTSERDLVTNLYPPTICIFEHTIFWATVCLCNPKKSAQPFRLSVRLKAIALMRTCDDRVRCHTCVRTRVDPLYMICLYGSWEKRFRGAYVSWRHTQSTRPRRR